MRITKPKRKSRIITEDKILQAAITVFSKFGFEKASLKQIGEKAGINEALIIRYYGSKAKLLVAIHQEYLDNLDLVIGDHPMCDTLEEEIKSYLLREMNSDLKNIDMRRIIISRASLDVKFRKEIENILQLDSLVNRLKNHQERGDISVNADLEQISRSIKYYEFGIGVTISVVQKPDRIMLEKNISQFASTMAMGLKAQAQS